MRKNIITKFFLITFFVCSTILLYPSQINALTINSRALNIKEVELPSNIHDIVSSGTNEEKRLLSQCIPDMNKFRSIFFSGSVDEKKEFFTMGRVENLASPVKLGGTKNDAEESNNTYSSSFNVTYGSPYCSTAATPELFGTVAGNVELSCTRQESNQSCTCNMRITPSALGGLCEERIDPGYTSLSFTVTEGGAGVDLFEKIFELAEKIEQNKNQNSGEINRCYFGNNGTNKKIIEGYIPRLTVLGAFYKNLDPSNPRLEIPNDTTGGNKCLKWEIHDTDLANATGPRTTTIFAPAPLPPPPPLVIVDNQNIESIPYSIPSTESIRPLGDISIQQFIGRGLRFVTGLFGSIALIMIIYGGLQIMFAAGGSERVKSGTKIILWASIGLITMLASYALVGFVFSTIM